MKNTSNAATLHYCGHCWRPINPMDGIVHLGGLTFHPACTRPPRGNFTPPDRVEKIVEVKPYIPPQTTWKSVDAVKTCNA